MEAVPPRAMRATAGRRGGSVLPAVLLVVSCAGAPAPSADPPPTPEPEVTGLRSSLVEAGWRIAEGKEGAFDVAWRSLAGELPRNRDFDMELRVLRGGAVVTGAQVRVRGWMPDHGHGLVRRPPVAEVEPGLHRVSGMLLHMRGHWVVYFDVIHEGVGDIVPFEVEL